MCQRFGRGFSLENLVEPEMPLENDGIEPTLLLGRSTTGLHLYNHKEAVPLRAQWKKRYEKGGTSFTGRKKFSIGNLLAVNGRFLSKQRSREATSPPFAQGWVAQQGELRGYADLYSLCFH